MKFHVKVEITGKLNGEATLQAIALQADMRMVPGFVQLNPNGSIYMEVEGTVEMLEPFLVWCKSDIPDTEIKEFIVLEYEGLKHYSGFSVVKDDEG